MASKNATWCARANSRIPISGGREYLVAAGATSKDPFGRRPRLLQTPPEPVGSAASVGGGATNQGPDQRPAVRELCWKNSPLHGLNLYEWKEFREETQMYSEQAEIELNSGKIGMSCTISFF